MCGPPGSLPDRSPDGWSPSGEGRITSHIGGPGLEVGAPILLFLHHDVPAIETVGTAVCKDVAWLDLFIRGEERDETGDPTAFHADNFLGWCHPATTGFFTGSGVSSAVLPVLKMITPMMPATIEPAKIPTLAWSDRV